MISAAEQPRKWRARKSGRPKKSGQREVGSDRPQRTSAAEREADILAAALWQPHRRDLKPGKRINVRKDILADAKHFDDREAGDGCRGPRDQRAGYAFGRLRLAGELTRIQHDALMHWLETYVSYTRALGLPQNRYGNTLAQAIGGGGGFDGDENNPDFASKRRHTAQAAMERLESALLEHLGAIGKRDADVAFGHVVLMDREPAGPMTGDLRSAANIIDRTLMGNRR